MDKTSIPGITYHRKPEIDLIVWSNKNVPKNQFFFLVGLVAWFLWTAIIIYVTSLLFKERSLDEKAILAYILIFGWLVSLFLPITLLSIFSTVTIIISEAEIIHVRSGLLAHKKRLKKGQVKGISFGHYNTLDGPEMLPTLNIMYQGKLIFQKRETIALWMRTREKHQLYLLLESILKERGWDIEYRLKYQPKVQ